MSAHDWFSAEPERRLHDNDPAQQEGDATRNRVALILVAGALLRSRKHVQAIAKLSFTQHRYASHHTIKVEYLTVLLFRVA